MRCRFLACAAALLALVAGVSQTAEPTPKEKEASKSALQAFNDYIGDWQANGETKQGKSEFWKEAISWGWKFPKDEAPYLHIEFKDSKNFTGGDLKYLPGKKKYQLTITDKGGKEKVFEGELKRKVLTFTSVDSSSKDKYTLNMSTTNEGALLNMDYAVQTGGVGIDKKLFIVQGKKEGSSISGGKKNVCVVSGGVGTRAVSFMGKTYYVCCSGCADAFAENPKKFVDEFEKKNKK
jgi:hypothetical protein